MTPAQRPIGIFDSGVGGLAALRALRAALPHERYVYVADLAHLPYGDLSAAQIRARTEAVTGHLRERGVKAIVAACNTVCAAAPQALAEQDGVPVFDVIDAGIDALAALRDVRRVGLLATRATVRERSHERRLRARRPDIAMQSVECPRLVPLIEEGRAAQAAATHALDGYLAELAGLAPDALLLGCTHYAFLRDAVQARLGAGSVVVDPSTRLAQSVRERLHSLDLLAPTRASSPPVEFVLTAQAARFRRVAHELLPALAAPGHSIFTTMPVTNSASFGFSPSPGSLL